MRPLDIDVIKTEEIFQSNYRLHDIACEIGDMLLEKNDFQVREYGEDRRKESVWEAGEDIPDRLVYKGSKPLFLLDYKAKRKEFYVINKRAYKAYLKCSKQVNLSAWVMFVILDIDSKSISNLKLSNLNTSKIINEQRMWNGNVTVEILPEDLLSLEQFLNLW